MSALAQPLGDLARQWACVAVKLKCRWCQEFYEGQRPAFFLTMANRRGDTDPWWFGDCPQCQAKEDERQREIKRELAEYRANELGDAYEGTAREGDFDPDTGKALPF